MATQFGNNLRELRMKKGYTQEDVAKKLQIDRTTYTKYETGKSEPDLAMIEKICQIFEVDYNTILINEKQQLHSLTKSWILRKQIILLDLEKRKLELELTKQKLKPTIEVLCKELNFEQMDSLFSAYIHLSNTINEIKKAEKTVTSF